MELPELLRKHGIDPEDFMGRVKAHWTARFIGITQRDRYMWSLARALGGDRRKTYVAQAFTWHEQPENEDFWCGLSVEWGDLGNWPRWPALEAAMGMLDPLEYELLEVGDEVT